MRSRKITHRWDLTPSQAVALQRELAGHVAMRPLPQGVRMIAGADVACSRDNRRLIAGLVLWDLHDNRIVERVVVQDEANFAYVPGLLSFRETPALLKAFELLRYEPDVVLCDAQGLAHPRRFGLACHLGVILDLPTVGCAKSKLCGTYEEPDEHKGAWQPLSDNGEVIGAVVRTRQRVKPVFVSVGHKADLDSAVDLVLRCTTRYRLPEPTRLAHQLVTQMRKNAT